MQLRILSGDDVRASIGMREAIEAMREAFSQLATGHACAPLRVPVEAGRGTTLFMPASLPAAGALGAKVVSVFPENPGRGLPRITALVLALDPDTGAPRAVLDGTWLTALRTGAASGLATELLAREDAAVVTIFGAGVQARTQLEGIRAVRPIREARILSRTRASAERFATELDGLDVRVLDDAAAALRGADIVIAATTSPTPVFDGRLVEPGAHVNGIGSYTPGMQEVDEALVRRARIVVDSREGAVVEAGDLVIPIGRGVITEADIHAELGEIVNGVRPGRTGPDEITFFKSVGNAVQDLAVAARVLRAAEAAGRGTVVRIGGANTGVRTAGGVRPSRSARPPG